MQRLIPLVAFFGVIASFSAVVVAKGAGFIAYDAWYCTGTPLRDGGAVDEIASCSKAAREDAMAASSIVGSVVASGEGGKLDRKFLKWAW